jgi:predicted RND superfamily exporter protein
VPTRRRSSGSLFGRLAIVVVVVLTSLATFAVLRGLRLDPNVASLLPDQGASAALARYLQGFGGGGLSVVLVEGEPAEAEAAAESIAAKLREDPSVAFAASRLELGATSAGGEVDPMLAWRFADARGRAALARALEPKVMHERLLESKKLLLLPGGGAVAERLQRDPLRLAELPLRERRIGAGVDPREDGAFATEDGRAHLVVVKPAGFSLRGADARAFHEALQRILGEAERPGVTVRATGPHVVSAEMEAMLRRDLTLSGVVSTVVASLAFVLVFRRLRALVAILPPLALGTFWTGSIAALYPSGLSALAVAFVSIVVGVGFDSGVHVYAAFLDARREGKSGADAAWEARVRTARPVLSAACIAAVAFGCLTLSSVRALAQLGALCAAGEILTAVAIVLVTPELARLVERGAPPEWRPPTLARWLHAVTATPRRAACVAVAAFAITALALLRGIPVADSLVAVRPSALPSLATEDRVFELFGGRQRPWILLLTGGSRDEVAARADALAERLAAEESTVESVDALTSVSPAPATQAQRLRERDALDLPKRAAELEAALTATGFAPARFEAALASMRTPSQEVVAMDSLLAGDRAVVAARYLADDGEALAVVHVHTRAGVGADALTRLVDAGDERATVTGYAKLEVDLRAALAEELPRIGAVAGALVLVLLALSLRRVVEVALATLVLVVGLGALFGLMGLLHVPLHIYSALVIPVLLGVSVDEAMFLLHHARDPEGDPIARTLDRETRPVVTTALTTSAGLVALVFADYDGLRHLGIVGAVGNVANLLTALLLVPAGLRLARAWRSD